MDSAGNLREVIDRPTAAPWPWINNRMGRMARLFGILGNQGATPGTTNPEEGGRIFDDRLLQVVCFLRLVPNGGELWQDLTLKVFMSVRLGRWSVGYGVHARR